MGIGPFQETQAEAPEGWTQRSGRSESLPWLHGLHGVGQQLMP